MQALRLVTAALVLAAPAVAQQWTDDFDRPDSDAPGPDWTESYGDMDVRNMMGVEGTGSANSKMAHNTASILYTDCIATVRMGRMDNGSGYVALIMGDGGGRNLFTKLQDNNGDRLFDTIYFYSNDNGTSYGTGSVVITTPVAECQLTVYVTNGGDTMNVDIDENYDGTPEQHYENNGILGFAASLGTGLGIGAWSGANWDDWSGGTGETLTGTPSSISMTTGGSQVLSMDVGAAFAGKTYQILGSLTGTAPGVTYTGVNVPLNFDPYLLFTLLNPNTPLLNGSAGSLNSLGQATAVLTIGPGSDPALAGLPLNHAGIVIDFAGPSLILTAATNAAPCTLTP